MVSPGNLQLELRVGSSKILWHRALRQPRAHRGHGPLTQELTFVHRLCVGDRPTSASTPEGGLCLRLCSAFSQGNRRVVTQGKSKASL